MRLRGPASAEPTGGAQPLAEADAHGIEVLRPAGRFDPRGHDRVEQPGAVEVGPEPCGGRPAADRFHRVVGLDPSAAQIVGVLDPHQPGPRVMHVAGPGQFDQLLRPQHSLAALDRPGDDAVDLRVAALLEIVDVATRLADHLRRPDGSGDGRR